MYRTLILSDPYHWPLPVKALIAKNAADLAVHPHVRHGRFPAIGSIPDRDRTWRQVVAE
jgi:hypothetical protein